MEQHRAKRPTFKKFYAEGPHLDEGGQRGGWQPGQRMPSNKPVSNSPEYREFQSLMYGFIDAINGKGSRTSLDDMREMAQELMSKHGVEDRWLVHHMKKANLGSDQVMKAIITPDKEEEPEVDARERGARERGVAAQRRRPTSHSSFDEPSFGKDYD
jgi:hypothetical protein